MAGAQHPPCAKPRTAFDLICALMGFNPFRQQQRTVVDVALVVVFALITFGFVAWAIFSG